MCVCACVHWPSTCRTVYVGMPFIADPAKTNGGERGQTSLQLSPPRRVPPSAHTINNIIYLYTHTHTHTHTYERARARTHMRARKLTGLCGRTPPSHSTASGGRLSTPPPPQPRPPLSPKYKRRRRASRDCVVVVVVVYIYNVICVDPFAYILYTPCRRCANRPAEYALQTTSSRRLVIRMRRRPTRITKIDY